MVPSSGSRLLHADLSSDKWTQIMLNSCKTSSKNFFKKFESRQCYFLILQLGSVKETSLPKASTSTNSSLNTCHLLSILFQVVHNSDS